MRHAVAILIVCLGFLLPSTVQADVSYGDKGPEVKQVQEVLRWLGYASVKADGVFGPKTLKAVKHWQRANGLLVDGIVGDITAGSLGIRGDQTQLTTPPSPPAMPRSVEQIIRDAWPDNLEEHALDIAWRESRHQPGARNFCCHGLFQIHWAAHRSWLKTVGVTSVDQLYDAETNARIAYMVYQRSNGWGPWRL